MTFDLLVIYLLVSMRDSVRDLFRGPERFEMKDYAGLDYQQPLPVAANDEEFKCRQSI